MLSKKTFAFVAISIFFAFAAKGLKAERSEGDSLKTFKTPSVSVTAERAVVGKSPAPFANLSKAEIQKSYVYDDAPALLSSLPSIIFYSENGNNVGYSYLFMRGFDQRRVSVFVNGIPQNDPEDHEVYWIDMPDIASNAENVQVQRGAGIVNYGAASIGGSVNLTTSNFVEKKGVKFFTGAGFQEYGGSGEIKQSVSKTSIEAASGLTGNYAVYARLSRINSTGYRKNSWAKLNSYFLGVARFDENFSTQINVFGGPLNDGLAYTGLPKEYIKDKSKRTLNPSYWDYDENGNIVYFTNRRKQEVEEFSQPHYEILNDWKINENLSLSSSLFYYTGDGYFDYDGSWAKDILKDWTSADYSYPSDSVDYFGNSLIRGFVGNKHGGWIPRLTWKSGSSELTVGGEIRFHRSVHWGKIVFSEGLPNGWDPDYKFYSDRGVRDIYSLFATERYEVAENLSLTAQAQLVSQRYAIKELKRGSRYIVYKTLDGGTAGENGEPIFDVRYLFFNPRLGINYEISENSNAYVFAAYTSREPRMKNLLPAEELYYGERPLFESDRTGTAYDFSKPLAKPEKMFDLELGWNLYEENYNLGVNFYWMEYSDELVSKGVVDIWGRPVDGNIPKTRHIGLEIQGRSVLANGRFGKLALSGNATISRNRIVKFDYVGNYGDIVSLDGNKIAGFPDFMANVKISYEKGKFYAAISGRYVGEMKTDNFGDLPKDPKYSYLTNYKDNTNDAYFTANLDLAYSFENVLGAKSLTLRAKVNNIFNELYSAYGIGKTFFPAAERNAFFGVEIGL